MGKPFCVTERRCADYQLINRWDAHDGALMTASEASAKLLRIASTRPELHMRGATSFLMVEEASRL